MRLASFNVENLFARAAALNSSEWVNEPQSNPSPWSAGRVTLDAYAKLNSILAQPNYSAQDKTKILGLLKTLGVLDDDEGDYVILRRNRGALLRRPRNKPVEVIATGRDDWIGWVELKKEAVNEIATQNTARVIKTVNPDVLVVMEADDRISLCRFNDQVLVDAVQGQGYEHIMLIDGNDERGIDVGLFARGGITIVGMRSHVDDKNGSDRIFSRDCAEYHLGLPSGDRLVVLGNHLKSKGYGKTEDNNRKRKAQATRVRQIYDELRQGGINNIAVMGDFNDTLDSDPLKPLFDNNADLQDVSRRGRPRTFGYCNKGDKIDHILLSQPLWAKVQAGGIERRGSWGGKNGTLWPHFPEVTKAVQAASDHAAIWVDLAL